MYTGSIREWVMDRIAEALGVSQWTISRDLRDLEVPSKSKHAKTARNPKGSGRPKGSRQHIWANEMQARFTSARKTEISVYISPEIDEKPVDEPVPSFLLIQKVAKNHEYGPSMRCKIGLLTLVNQKF